jgi:hypothetical protein
MSTGHSMARAADAARDRRHERLKSICERLAARAVFTTGAEELTINPEHRLETLARELRELVDEGP